MPFNSEQEKFWATTYAQDYIRRNSAFDNELGAKAWRTMLGAAHGAIRNYLECGCNIGRNLDQLGIALPGAKASVIEISKPAFEYVKSKHQLAKAFNGAILDSKFTDGAFDLVFTMGVLIHINPDHLLQHMEKMFSYSSRFVLFGEYFNRTPVALEYQGQQDKLY
jgi:spore coat polysaccharide biosynthesis protein SpsF